MAKVSPDGRHGILYVIGSLDVGGTERHLVLIAPLLQRLGWRATVYCVERRGRQAAKLEAAGVTVIGPPLEIAAKRPSRFARAFRLALSAAKLLWLMVRRRPAIVHFFLPVSYLVGAPLAILAQVPVRVMSRRSLNFYQRDWPLVQGVEKRLHKHMSAILANSQRVSQQLVDQEGVEPDRIRLIYNGVDVSALDAAQPGFAEDQNSLDPSRPVTMIMVANLIPYKGHVDLLRALAAVGPRLPPWRLQCVGRDDGNGAKLLRLAGELGLQERVEFLGERADVASLLKSADIGILCSHQEGFANAILESMAAGLPLVVTDVGGNAEAVADGETGLVVPARDSQALGTAIATLAGDKALRQRMGAAGRCRVVERFSLDACVSRYDRLYRDLLGEAEAGRLAKPACAKTMPTQPPQQ